MAVLGRHYPGRSGHILLVHGGTMVVWVCRALRPLTPQSARDKLKVTKISRVFEALQALCEVLTYRRACRLEIGSFILVACLSWHDTPTPPIPQPNPPRTPALPLDSTSTRSHFCARLLV